MYYMNEDLKDNTDMSKAEWNVIYQNAVFCK